MKITEMRALTLTQPWAYCLMEEGMNVENRSWNTHQRGYVAIHASSTFSNDKFEKCRKKFKVDVDADELDYGSIIGFAKLIDVITTDNMKAEKNKWFEGEYGFVFEDVIKLKEPVEIKGSLNFWKLKGKELKACLSQLSESQIKKLTNHH